MSGYVQCVDLMAVVPGDVTVQPHQDFAVGRITEHVTIFPAVSVGRRGTNESLGQLAQIGERLAREARRAGHAHRTELRTRLLAVAIEECDKRADHRRDMATLRAELGRLRGAS